MLMAHPNRVPADVALADLHGFERAQEALRIVLAQATPFTGTIPVGVPVTIAWSARDLVLPIWQADVAKAQLPQATHLVIDSAGHSPMWDQPKRCAEILLAGSAPVATVEPLRPVTRRRPPRRNSSPGEALG
jgi:pimeloyl-ACP methyl ester carboxylesterase